MFVNERFLVFSSSFIDDLCLPTRIELKRCLKFSVSLLDPVLVLSMLLHRCLIFV